MNRPDCPNETDHAERVAACVTAFASAIKNITIYPADHPRVFERASAFIAEHEALGCAAKQLIVGKDDVQLDGVSITTDHLAVDWLRRRCRETGTGAIFIEPNCCAHDVITFASALIACPPGSGISLADSWRDETACIRPLALVIEERRAPEQAGGAATASSEIAKFNPDASLHDKIRAIAGMPSIRHLTKSIAGCDTSDELATESVDLLAMIAEVLPVDCPTDPQGLQETIEDILQRTHGQLQDAARTDSNVRSAHLLRSAVDIAKTYFGRSSKGTTGAPQQPSGRPGDEAIQADLGALIRELKALPDASDVALPPATEFVENAPAMAKELLGICLYGLTSAEQPDVRSNRMRTIAEVVQQRPDDCTDLLDTYLLPGSRSTDMRLRLLRALVDRDLEALVRDRNYLDDALLRAGFPEVLPIAARVFKSPDELARVRQALDDLTTVIKNGGAKAAVSGGLLEDVATVQLLAHCGGKIALQLLANCKSNSPDVQQALLHCVQGIELPKCEQIVMHLYSKSEVPAHYVRRLLRSAARSELDDALRNASGGLIRDFVNAHLQQLPTEILGPAVDALRHAPSQETEQFLHELVRLGRFSLRRDLRELRRHAVQTLAALKTKPPSASTQTDHARKPSDSEARTRT